MSRLKRKNKAKQKSWSEASSTRARFSKDAAIRLREMEKRMQKDKANYGHKMQKIQKAFEKIGLLADKEKEKKFYELWRAGRNAMEHDYKKLDKIADDLKALHHSFILQEQITEGARKAGALKKYIVAEIELLKKPEIREMKKFEHLLKEFKEK